MRALPLLLALSACSAAPLDPPTPAPAPSPTIAEVEQPLTVAPTAAPLPPASAAATASASAAPEATIVIHRSEIYASVVARRGKVVDLISLLMTSDTLPAAGTKAVLFRKAAKKESGDWIPLGEVTLQKFSDGGKIEIKLGDDSPTGKGEIFKKDLSVKIQIDR